MKDKFSDVIRSVQRYPYQDGTRDMLAGFLMLLGAFAFEARHPLLTGVTFIVGVVVISIFIRRFLQEHFVYPRSGYATYSITDNKVCWQTFGIGGLLGLTLLALFFHAMLHDPLATLNWIDPAMSLLIGGLLIWRGFSVGIMRFSLQGIFSILFGMAVSPLVLSPETYGSLLIINGLLFYLMFMGAMLVISGLVVFTGYLRQNPLKQESNYGE